MPRRAIAEAALPPSLLPQRLLRATRVLFYITIILAFAIGVVVLCLKTEQFVITDARFTLPGPPEPGIASEFFRIEHATFASQEQIEAVFARDFGRSIYLCPIAERRRRLLAIDWVKDASVLRIWPNRLVINITERTPVAFVQVASVYGSMSYQLIDSDGILLDPQRNVKLALPVLSGFPANDPPSMRKDRVKRFLRMQTELGPLMAKISEVDVADIDNLKATQVIEDKAFLLLMGNQNFEERMQNFLANSEQIRERLPDARIFDLRLKDRITTVGGRPAVHQRPTKK